MSQYVTGATIKKLRERKGLKQAGLRSNSNSLNWGFLMSKGFDRVV